MLQGMSFAVVATTADGSGRLAGQLRAAGAEVVVGVVHVDAQATLSDHAPDAVVLAIGADPLAFLPLAISLREDARTRSLPLVGVVDGEVPSGRLAPLELARMVPANDLDALPEVLRRIADRSRTAAAGARELEVRLRSALDRLAQVRAESQALTHDGRMLCGVTLGLACNLRDGILGPVSDAQRAQLQLVVEAAGDVAGLLERYGASVQTHSVPPAEATLPAGDRRAPRRTHLDLSDLARTTARAFASAAEQKGLSLAVDAPDPVLLWGDALQMKQVAVNLITNALKFTPAGGRIHVGVRRTTASARGVSRPHAELSVEDTGPGIPAADRERVFERGFRLTRDEGIAGSGIGLWVARGIATSHGGGVRAEASSAGGARLVVELPLDMRARRDSGGVLVVVPPSDAPVHGVRKAGGV